MVTLQEAILKKSDGMFLWVILAMKDIMENSYDATYEDLEELVNDLPAGLIGLYEKSWIKLVKYLPTAKVALAKKVLTWVLLAQRQLTITELTTALAVEPSDREIPPRKKLLRNLSSFALHYLAPFIEVISYSGSADDQASVASSARSFGATDSKIRIVHQSAQEYLLEAWNNKVSLEHNLVFDLRDGHELIGRSCLAYLSCDSLQLGWIDPDNKNEYGDYITNDLLKQKVKERLIEFPFLEYASTHWHHHVRKCQWLPSTNVEREEDDIFTRSLDFLKNYPLGVETSAQIRQVIINWDHDTHFGPAPLLHSIAARDISIILNRLLKDPSIDLSLKDSAGCVVLHYPALGEIPADHPVRHNLSNKEELIKLINAVRKRQLQ